MCIRGHNDGGLWSVKGIIAVDGIRSAYFQPVAEHLIVCQRSCCIEIGEMREEHSGGKAVRPTELLVDLSVKKIKTISSHMIDGPRPMLPVTQNAVAFIDQTPPEREPSHQAEGLESWSQWNISKFPTEVISHIFACMGCDTIAQIHNTCLVFREVAQRDHEEAFFYRQFPEQFKKLYLQCRLWQQRLAKSGRHPFIAELPKKYTRVLNTEQQAAVLCCHTLRNMMSTSEYRPREVLAYPENTRPWLKCSQVSSTVWLHDGEHGKLTLLGQSDSCSAQEIVLEGRSVQGCVNGLSFHPNGGLVSIFSRNNIIDNLKRDPDSGQWQMIEGQLINEHQVGAATYTYFQLSPSGKYVIVRSSTDQDRIGAIMCCDDQGRWTPMPMAEEAKETSVVEKVYFSPSEQHLAICCPYQVVILSLDSHGCWNFSWSTPDVRRVGYVEFCPSGGWLLIVLNEHQRDIASSADLIRFDREWSWWQTIACEDCLCPIAFSPGGRYLVSDDYYWFWRLGESGKWEFYCELTGFEELPRLFDNIALSPCDNYLLDTDCNSLVTIWEQDEQGCWTVDRGSEQHNGKVSLVKFSQSGVHALTVDVSSIRIWGRNEGGLWSVKGGIPANRVVSAEFHPVAEHLIVFRSNSHTRIWELRKES